MREGLDRWLRSQGIDPLSPQNVIYRVIVKKMIDEAQRDMKVVIHAQKRTIKRIKKMIDYGDNIVEKIENN